MANNLASLGDAAAPVDFGGGRTARYLSVGHHTSCAVLDTGNVTCWCVGVVCVCVCVLLAGAALGPAGLQVPTTGAVHVDKA